MSRMTSFLLAVILTFGAVVSFSNTASAQETVTLTLNLATCPVTGSANSISIHESLDLEAEGCELGWPTAPEFHLNGRPMATGDPSAPVAFPDLIPGEEYWLQEVNAPAVFDDGYTFTAPDSDVTLWAVFDLHQRGPEPGEETDGSGQEESVPGEVSQDPGSSNAVAGDSSVSGLPQTGSGTSAAATSVGALPIIGMMLLSIGAIGGRCLLFRSRP